MDHPLPYSEAELEERLSRPSEAVQEAVQQLTGDVAVLGAGGKMGPTLSVMLKRAAPKKTVYAVSRFADRPLQDRLETAGIKTISADLLDPDGYGALPQVPNVYYLVGMKFGTTGNQPLTWAINTFLPGRIAAHYRQARMVVFSTGNVYPFVHVEERAPDEEVVPEPVGEYAQSCLGRERIFQYFTARYGIPMAIVRLNYANEPRYGIIVDVVQKILGREPIDLRVPAVNLIWQRDAVDYIIRSIGIAQTPPAILNTAGPEIIMVRDLALQIGQLVGQEPVFAGPAGTHALLSDASRCVRLFGPPEMGPSEMISTIVDWVTAGGRVLNRPTKFQVRDGRF